MRSRRWVRLERAFPVDSRTRPPSAPFFSPHPRGRRGQSARRVRPSGAGGRSAAAPGGGECGRARAPRCARRGEGSAIYGRSVAVGRAGPRSAARGAEEDGNATPGAAATADGLLAFVIVACCSFQQVMPSPRTCAAGSAAASGWRGGSALPSAPQTAPSASHGSASPAGPSACTSSSRAREAAASAAGCTP